MILNAFQFLRAIYLFLDLVEKDLYGHSTNHGARVVFMALKMSHLMNLNDFEILDLLLLALMHDNGISPDEITRALNEVKFTGLIPKISSKEHCIRGEENLRGFPLFTDPKNVILYHHEHFDGTGIFGVKGDDIPLMSQIIYITSHIDSLYNFDLAAKDLKLRNTIIDYANNNKNTLFSEKISDAFLQLTNDDVFWNVFLNHNISNIVKKETASYNLNLTYSEIRERTTIFSRIIDASSLHCPINSSKLEYRFKTLALEWKAVLVVGN